MKVEWVDVIRKEMEWGGRRWKREVWWVWIEMEWDGMRWNDGLRWNKIKWDEIKWNDGMMGYDGMNLSGKNYDGTE